MPKPKSKVTMAWGLIPKEYNPDREIKEVQFHEPKNPITYKFSEVVRVQIKEVKK